MKIALACHSILLERALSLFLKSYIVPLKQCDFVIADTKANFDHPVFVIGSDEAHIAQPFSKTALLLALKEFYTCIIGPSPEDAVPLEAVVKTHKKDFALLETKISTLTDKFREELIHTIKSHYE